MTNKEAVNWIINLSADIGKSEHSELWHYEQALYEIREMLESAERKGRWVGANEYAKHLTEKTGKFYMLSSIETDRLFCNQCWKFGGKLKTNYCPHCGAKMELKEE